MASRALPEAAPALAIPTDARAVLLLAPLLLLFLQFRHAVDFIALEAPEGVWIWSALTLAVTTAMAAMARWRDLPVWGRRFGKASAAFLIFYFAIEPMVMPHVGLPGGRGLCGEAPCGCSWRANSTRRLPDSISRRSTFAMWRK
jgi:hypothetical protein